jgi:hypothetical protein
MSVSWTKQRLEPVRGSIRNYGDDDGSFSVTMPDRDSDAKCLQFATNDTGIATKVELGVNPYMFPELSVQLDTVFQHPDQRQSLHSVRRARISHYPYLPSQEEYAVLSTIPFFQFELASFQLYFRSAACWPLRHYEVK